VANARPPWVLVLLFRGGSAKEVSAREWLAAALLLGGLFGQPPGSPGRVDGRVVCAGALTHGSGLVSAQGRLEIHQFVDNQLPLVALHVP
jgi:hypothetical protein